MRAENGFGRVERAGLSTIDHLTNFLSTGGSLSHCGKVSLLTHFEVQVKPFLEMKLQFSMAPRPSEILETDWQDWTWQMRHSLKSETDFSKVFDLLPEEKDAFKMGEKIFNFRTTPYYRSLVTKDTQDPLRKILVPHSKELDLGRQQMLDPLGEKQNNPAPRVIHRYPDRALFLVTDLCSVYCRYCTRKHFTGQEQAFPKQDEYEEAINYFRNQRGIREVILSGGDPLTLGDKHLEKVLSDLRALEHIEIIRIGTRMPVVCPMRITPDLVQMLRKYKPVYVMTHFNHPRELTQESARALENLVDHGIPVFNQMVMLNGVNNHAAIVQALSRRLLFLRVKPYYLFQCDPSEGTDHLRTSVEETLQIQKELWGTLSGLAMPQFSLDIPDGGGKVALVPNFQIAQTLDSRKYRGWDGIEAEYKNPDSTHAQLPGDWREYIEEWQITKSAKKDI